MFIFVYLLLLFAVLKIGQVLYHVPITPFISLKILKLHLLCVFGEVHMLWSV